MSTDPAMSGEIPAGGVLDILREIEAQRITGLLRFTAAGPDGQTQTGEIELIAGQVALDQDPLPDGTDPVERFLALRGGLYVVHQRLPPLPVSQGDDHVRTGSLAVHVPADLMNYCEQAGLTGTLTFRRGREKVEVVYEHGDLLAIRVDGRDDGDLRKVFEWEDGTFRIEANTRARALVPDVEPMPADADEDASAREPTTQFVRRRARRDETGRQFLKVFEVALTEVIASRDRARPATRTSPIHSARPSVRPRPPSMPPRKDASKREPTVRIVYLEPDDSVLGAPSPESPTRHASPGGTRDAELPEARPERRTSQRTSAPAQPHPDRREGPARSPGHDLAPIAWIVAAVALGVLTLVLLR